MEAIQRLFMQSSSWISPEAAGRSLLWIIALPLLGAFTCGVFGRYLGRANVHLVAVGSVAGSFLLSLLVFVVLNDPRATAPSPLEPPYYAVGHDFGTWFSAGNFRVNFGLLADHLSGSMLLVITGIGALIHLYSTEYMSHDAGYWRFFAYLNLFVAAMLTLVLADSLPLLFVGWEGVGLCSYLLIGFWFDDPAKAYAGRKAFVTNRVGDFGFLLASFLLVLTVESLLAAPPQALARGNLSGEAVQQRLQSAVRQVGPLSFVALEETARTMPRLLEEQVASGPLKAVHHGALLTVIVLLFMLGAAGKSAQIPLYVWLPDAMAGPTPVSALIHAATMVTSGIYLFCRLSYLVVLSPNAMAVIAMVGALTALLAALIAVTQTGLKKVLAYSTVSQLGFMFIGIGAGAFWAAFLHVVTHAFFKACLFLGAGSVMHGNGDEEDATKLGGLRKEMPTTWATFAVATLAITGIVPLSGFFSKDAILNAASLNELEGVTPWLRLAWGLGLLTAFVTAFYMSRLYILTFEGERSPEAKVAHAHESGPAILWPLGILAFFSVAAVAHGVPALTVQRGEHTVVQAMLENWLDPVFRTTYSLAAATHGVHLHPEEHIPWGAYGMAWAIALAGGGLAAWAFLVFFPGRKGQPLGGVVEVLRSLSFNKFYVDEAYELVILRPVRVGAQVLFRVMDALVIDGVLVRGAAWMTARTGAVLRYVQSGDAQNYATVMAVALVAALAWVLLRGGAS